MPKKNAIIMVLTVLLLLATVNVIAARFPLRADLTENRTYTLAPATHDILKHLDDIVSITVYFTEELPPQLTTLRRNVEDLLAEIKRASNARVRVAFVDPNSSMLDEQKAALLGIPPIQLNVLKHDRQEVAKIYLGMAVTYGDQQQVLPVVQRLETLEYDLVEAILKVTTKEMPPIAWWETPTDSAAAGGFSLIRQALERRYTIVPLNAETAIDADPKRFPALVLASPRTFSNEALVWLDQYLMGGGRIIALIDRFDIDGQLNVTPVETNVTELLTHYGVTADDELVLDTANAMASFSGGIVTYHMPYPYWPDVQKAYLNSDEPIVADLESIVLPWTSPLTLATTAAETGTPLATTTDQAIAIPAHEAQLDPQAAAEAMAQGKPATAVLSALLDGPFSSFFADRDRAPKGATLIGESPASARLFVVGSSRWVSDSFLQVFPANAAFFQNAVDAFAMGDALIGIRSREQTTRPIAALSETGIAFFRWTNLLIGPIIVLVIALVVFLMRRARSRSIQRRIGSRREQRKASPPA